MRVLWYFQRSRNWNNEVQRDDLYFIQDALKEFSPSFPRASYGNPCDSNGFHTRGFQVCFWLRHKFLRTRNITRWRNNRALLSVSLSRLKFSSLFFCSLFNLGSAYDPEPRCVPEKKKPHSHLYAWNQADKKAKACWQSRGLGREITTTLKGKRVWKLEVKLMNSSQEREREWRRKGERVKFWEAL